MRIETVAAVSICLARGSHLLEDPERQRGADSCIESTGLSIFVHMRIKSVAAVSIGLTRGFHQIEDLERQRGAGLLH